MSDEQFRDLKVETLLAYYEAARAEILERLNIRANIAVLYIGAIGAVAGYALGAPLERFYLAPTVIAFLAWGAALLYFQQDRVIDQLSKHCAKEICPKLWKEEAVRPLSIDEKLFPQKERQRKGPCLTSKYESRASCSSTCHTPSSDRNPHCVMERNWGRRRAYKLA